MVQFLLVRIDLGKDTYPDWLVPITQVLANNSYKSIANLYDYTFTLLNKSHEN